MTFRIKIETDGKDVFKTLKVDAEDFSIAIEQTYYIRVRSRMPGNSWRWGDKRITPSAL
ncbi:MAG: hypothetical protein PUG21_08075 [Prevotella sp.]|nr:hypothetical protein [Prevotella sp.]